MKKNERRLTRVRQSKFFFKALENTIKISIPYKNTVYFRFNESTLFLLLCYFKGVNIPFIFGLKESHRLSFSERKFVLIT